MNYESPPIGNRITAVMYGINSLSLLDNGFLRKVFEKALKASNFNVLGFIDHNFDPVGYSAVALLSESDAAIHSYPEYNSVDLNLVTCRGPKDGRKTLISIIEDLNPYCTQISESPVIVKPMTMAQISKDILEDLLEGFYLHRPTQPTNGEKLPLEWIGYELPKEIAGVPNNLLRENYAP